MDEASKPSLFDILGGLFALGMTIVLYRRIVREDEQFKAEKRADARS